MAFTAPKSTLAKYKPGVREAYRPAPCRLEVQIDELGEWTFLAYGPAGRLAEGPTDSDDVWVQAARLLAVSGCADGVDVAVEKQVNYWTWREDAGRSGRYTFRPGGLEWLRGEGYLSEGWGPAASVAGLHAARQAAFLGTLPRDTARSWARPLNHEAQVVATWLDRPGSNWTVYVNRPDAETWFKHTGRRSSTGAAWFLRLADDGDWRLQQGKYLNTPPWASGHGVGDLKRAMLRGGVV